jgi:hypothetical protein
MRYKSFCEYFTSKEKLDKDVNEYLQTMSAWNNKIETKLYDGRILVTIISK